MGKPQSPEFEGPTDYPETWLRKLDLDDIYLLAYFYDNIKATHVSEILTLSAPAITSRSNRISEALGFKVFQRVRGRSILTDNGRVVAKLAKKAIKILCEFNPSGISVSARMEFGASKKLTKPAVLVDFVDDEEFGETDDCGYLGPKV